jgi:signal transduction histidine kinase
VVEGLTNIRRHAPNTPLATVTVGWSAAGGVEVAVVNEASANGHQDLGPRSYGGNGLAGLRDRVTTAGGVLSAGPDGHGWRLTATFPAVPAPATSPPA